MNVQGKILSRKQITDLFISIENKYNLLQYKIKGIYVWQISRVSIYLKIIDTFTCNNNLNSSRIFHKYRDLSHRLFINCFFFNPFIFLKRKNDILVFDSGRKYKNENDFIDIYTNYLCNDLDKMGLSYTLYETNYKYDLPLLKRSIHTKHLDFIYLLSNFLSSFFLFRLRKQDIKFIKIIEDEMHTNYGIHVDILSIIIHDIRIFKSQYPFYKALFKIKVPKQIYIINSSDKPAIIAAAKKQNIAVNELQHGLISNAGIVCNFPDVKADSLQYFPDRFYVWKNINMCYTKLPLSENNIIHFENQHLNKWIQKTSSIPKITNTILVVSQPYSSIDIINFISQNLKYMPHYNFIYKIHPAENSVIMMEYKKEITQKYDNISFTDNEESIYILLKKSEYVIGVFSSALFEAKHFSCKIILLNLPGVEMSYPLLEEDGTKLLNISDKLIDAINKN